MNQNNQRLLLFKFPCFALFVALFASFSSSHGQTSETGSIRGIVSNVSTNQFLEGAFVQIEGTNRVVYTDRQGSFRFAQLSPGSYVVIINYTGLDAERRTVDVAAGIQSEVRVDLTSDIYQLAEFSVVTEREGNAAAISQRRAAPNIKDVLATDAFGTISDDNVGNLLQRLPSISADFSSGDVTYVRVRGIDPNLNSVMVDGTRMANEDLIDTRRRFRFNQFSMANIEKVEITKAPTPDMDADSIGGAINLVTKSAFDSQAGRRSSVSMGFYYRLSDRPDEGSFDFSLHRRQLTTKLQPTGKFFYSDVVGKKKNIGIRIDGNFTPRYAAREVASSQYQATSDSPAYTWQFQLQDGTRHVRTKAGLGIRLDYKQNERSSYYLTAKYDYLHHTNELNGITLQTSQSIATVDGSGQVTGGGMILPDYTDQVTEARVHNNTFIRLTANDPEQVNAFSRNVVFAGRHQLGNWNIDHDINVSEARSNIPTGTDGAYMFADLRGVGWRIDRTGSNTLPRIVQTGGPDWYNLDNFRHLNVRLDDVRHGVDTIIGGQLNAKREFDTRHPIYLKSGVRYRQQTRDLELTRRNLDYIGPDGVPGVNPNTGVDDGSLLRFLDTEYQYEMFGRYQPFQFPRVSTVRAVMAENPDWFSENYYTSATTTLRNARDIRESVTAAYLMGNARINRLSILTGVRMEQTEVTGTGARRADVLAPNPGVGETREQADARASHDWGQRETSEGSYTNYFPGIHGTFEINRNFLFRASWTTGIGRPNFAEIIPNTTVNINNETISVTNPNIKPQFSDNYDLSLEYYLQPSGLASVGVFKKEIENFIGRTSEIVSEGPNNGFNGDYAGYLLSKNINQGGATIQGVEFSYQQQFTFLPIFWRNFGGYANYTYLKLAGDQDDEGLGGRRELGGFVPKAANAGISYISNRISVRLQGNYRGDSVQQAAANPVNTLVRSTYKTVNLNLGFKLSDRWSVYADWINIFKETEEQHYLIDPSRVRSVFQNDPEITFGLTGRF